MSAAPIAASVQQPVRNISTTPPRLSTTSSTSSTSHQRRGLGAIPLNSNSSFSAASSQASAAQARSSLSGQTRSSLSMAPPIVPQKQSNPPFMAQSNTNLFQSPSPPTFQPTSTPNYNISLSAAPIVPVATNPVFPTQAPPGMGSVLTPSKPAQPSWSTAGPKQLSKDDWGDFDPLS